MPPPHLVDPSFVEFVVTSEYNSKFKLEIPALHRASEHICSFESGTFQRSNSHSPLQSAFPEGGAQDRLVKVT